MPGGGTGCGNGSSGNPFSSRSSSSGGKPLLESSSSSSSGKPLSSPAKRIGETLRRVSGTARRRRLKLGEPCIAATTAGLVLASPREALSWGGLGCEVTGQSGGDCFAGAGSVLAAGGLFPPAASAPQGVAFDASLLLDVVGLTSAVSLTFSSSLSSSDRIMRRFLANFLSPSSEAASLLSSSSSSLSSVSSSSELLRSCFFGFCGAGFFFSGLLVSFCGFFVFFSELLSSSSLGPSSSSSEECGCRLAVFRLQLSSELSSSVNSASSSSDVELARQVRLPFPFRFLLQRHSLSLSELLLARRRLELLFFTTGAASSSSEESSR